MTFLKKYGLSSLSFNFLLTVICIQWNILTSGTHGFWHCVYHDTWKRVPIVMDLLIESDFAAACCLISMGAVLGKTNAVQLVVMAVFELVFFNANLALCFSWLKVADQGGSIVVHVFGAFFGLAVSYIVSPKAAVDHEDNSSSRTSDTFAMIGTLFLWMFWPSFNGALATGQMQNLVVVNTTLALCGSAVATFMMSYKLRGVRKFDMVDVQNATLAGGVAVGAISNMVIGPAGAVGIGFVAGSLCVVGYVKIAPLLESKLGVQDTCGVQNLHGYSGLLGAIASIITLAVATEENYGKSYGFFFTENRGPGKAAAYQAASLGLTLLIAIVSGLITGVIVKKFATEKVNSRLFEDDVNFTIEEEEAADDYKKPAADGYKKPITINEVDYNLGGNKY
jgi:ammonium transporter Rh